MIIMIYNGSQNIVIKKNHAVDRYNAIFYCSNSKTFQIN